MNPDSIKDGGPAFPFVEPPTECSVSTGMTLRDYFAGKAMAAQLTATSAERDYADIDWVRDVNGPTIGERLARMAYRMADEMLAARGGA